MNTYEPFFYAVNSDNKRMLKIAYHANHGTRPRMSVHLVVGCVFGVVSIIVIALVSEGLFKWVFAAAILVVMLAGIIVSDRPTPQNMARFARTLNKLHARGELDKAPAEFAQTMANTLWTQRRPCGQHDVEDMFVALYAYDRTGPRTMLRTGIRAYQSGNDKAKAEFARRIGPVIQERAA